jgi:hypothetical protein
MYIYDIKLNPIEEISVLIWKSYIYDLILNIKFKLVYIYDLILNPIYIYIYMLVWFLVS